ncbi:hypothetical protein vseg_015721 [Gypsophila vaccaria]
MLSTISPFSQPDSVVGGVGYGSVFPSSQGGFLPWESFESFFVSVGHRQLTSSCDDLKEDVIDRPDFKPNVKQNHAGLESGLDDPVQIPLGNTNHESPNDQSSTITSSGSDDSNQNSAGLNIGTSNDDEPNQTTSTTTDVERKRKRKISNRESARRSRMRKQQHIENLRDEANRLKLENQEGMNRLRLITHNIHLVTRDNDRLKGESVILQRRLMELNQIWQVQQLHRNYNNNINHNHDNCNLVHPHSNYLT